MIILLFLLLFMQGIESTTLLGVPHVITTSIGMCDMDIRAVSIFVLLMKVRDLQRHQG